MIPLTSLYSPIYQELISALKESREKNGITQAALAERAGMTQSYISKIEKCERKLDVVIYFELAAAVNLDINDIVSIIKKYIPQNKN